MDELRVQGFLSVPVTVTSSQAIQGFNPDRLAEVFQLDVNVALNAPSRIVPLLGRVLKAVERVVRQMPDDKLDWAIPGRSRPLSELAYHIFARVENIMEELATGSALSRSDASGGTYASFQEIAGYGRKVTEEFCSWASQQDCREAPQTALGDEPGSTRMAERLDHVAAHSIHHLRQLYLVLEDFGITPEDRLEDSELPPEYVLSILW